MVLSGAAARGPRARVQPYLAALRLELELRADALDAAFGPPGGAGRRRLASVYFGGGTPSLLPVADVAALLELVARRHGLAADAEVTLEANPGPAELGDLAGFRAAGVNRLSLGAQSLAAAELRRLGRRHRPQDVGAAVAAARRAGIGNISLDLLYDVPGQTLASWSTTLDGALALGPDHVSAYALTLDDPDAEGITGPLGDHLPVRPGARRWRDRARREQDGDLAADLYALADERLRAAGLGWYELSNWARAGRASRHNLAYWQYRAYEAVGLGAHAFDGGATRRWNAARLEPYLAALAPDDGALPRLPPGGAERLDARTRRGERAVLGLRLAAGLPRRLAATPGVAEPLAWGAANGLVEGAGGGRVMLTPRGRLLANELFARLV